MSILYEVVMEFETHRVISMRRVFDVESGVTMKYSEENL